LTTSIVYCNVVMLIEEH